MIEGLVRRIKEGLVIYLLREPGNCYNIRIFGLYKIITLDKMNSLKIYDVDCKILPV